jgi:hypothetical protein
LAARLGGEETLRQGLATPRLLDARSQYLSPCTTLFLDTATGGDHDPVFLFLRGQLLILFFAEKKLWGQIVHIFFTQTTATITMFTIFRYIHTHAFFSSRHRADQAEWGGSACPGLRIW